MAKSEKYVLRHAKNRYKKGKASKEDIELIKKYNPELLKDTIEVEKTEIKETSNREFKEVENSAGYYSTDSKSFIDDANQFTKNDFEPLEFEAPKSETFESESFEQQQIQYLNGAMLLFLIDLIAPEIMAFIGKKFLKKNIKASDLKSHEELMQLEEIADKVAEDIQTDNLSPVNMLIMGCAFIYIPKMLS